MWQKIKTWFHDSEVIFFARLQVALGVAMAVIPTLNPMAWFDPSLTSTQRWTMAAWAVASGVITEIARRARATDL